jgi:hypothetical protein
MDGSTTKADADETPPTGRMNPEYDYLFKLLVRARDDAMRCVRAVNAFRFGLDHSSGTRVCRCDLVLGMHEWNA